MSTQCSPINWIWACFLETSFSSRTMSQSSILPMVIFSKVRLGITPDINALATIIIVVVTVGVVIAAVVMNRQEQRRLRDSQIAAVENK